MDAQANLVRESTDSRKLWQIPAVAFAVALLVMLPAVCVDEAFALHKHDDDSRAGHPSIPPLDYRGNNYHIYLDRDTRQLVFHINMHTDNLDPEKSYVIGFVNGGSATYVNLDGYDYVTSIDGNWTKYVLTLTSDNMRNIESLYAAKDAQVSLKFGLEHGAIYYYDDEHGYVDSRNVQHSLKLVDVLDRNPHLVLINSDVITLEQGDAYSDAGIDCIDNDDYNPILSHNVSSTAHAGQFVVEYTCVDNSGNEASPVYKMLHVSTKNPPVVVAPADPLQIVENTELLYYLQSDNPDAEFSLVTHNTSHRTGPAPTVTAEGKISWTPSENQGGHGDIYRITVKAIDAYGGSSPQIDILVKVAESNLAPSIMPFEPLDAPHGKELLIDVSANVVDSDVPKNALVYSKSGVGSIDANTGVFTWTPLKSDAGTYLVNFTASDGKDESTATQTITILDVTPPVIDTISDITIQGDLPLTVQYPPFTAVDLVDGSVPVMCTPASDTLFTQTVTSVICNARDAAGNEATSITFDVIINPHVIEGPEPVIPVTEVSVQPTTAYDNIGETDYISIQTNLTSTLKLGDSTDNRNNTDTTSNPEIVVKNTTTRDTTPPIISQAPDVHVQSSSLPVSVSYAVPSAVDAIDGAVPVKCTPPSGHSFTKSNTTVTCNAHDSQDNKAIPVTFNVIITPIPDTTAPTINPSTINAIEAVGPLTTVSILLPTVSDNIDVPADITIQTNLTGAFETVTEPVLHKFKLGEHIVHWRATDMSNNTESAIQTIIIQDTTPPIISPARDISVQSDLPSNIISYDAPFAIDAVDGTVSVVCTPPPSGHSFTKSNTTVTCNAHDVAGNKAAPVTFDVIITLNTEAHAIDPSAVITMNATGPITTIPVIDDLDAERKQLHETIKKLKKDVKKLRNNIGETFDSIAGTDKKFTKQQKKITSLEKSLDKLRDKTNLKKNLLDFYVNPERVFQSHGVDSRTGNHVLTFLSEHAQGCDATLKEQCSLSFIRTDRDKNSNSMMLNDIRNLEFWPNRTIYAGDTFEWQYQASGKMGTVSITSPDGSKVNTSPGSSDSQLNGTTSQLYTFDTPGVFNWSADEHLSANGTITVVTSSPLQFLLVGAKLDATGSQNLEQSEFAIFESKIALWNEKIDYLKDMKKDLRKTLKSAKNGEFTLNDLYKMNRAEINDLSKATKYVKQKMIKLDDALVYHTQP